MAPKKDKSNYVFRFKEDQVLIKKPGDLDGADFAISNCKNCEIYIFDHIAQIFVDDSQNCKVYIGPTKGSVFVRDCQDIELHSSSSQLRISDTKNIKAYVFAQSDPTLENTSGLVLAPYSFLFPGLKEHFQAAGLVASEDKWSQVFDFTPSKDSTKNWTLMNPVDYQGPVVKEIEGVEGDHTSPIPVAKIYGGDSDIQIILGSADDSNQVIDGMATFNIHVSQQQAQEVFEQTVETTEHQQVQENQATHQGGADDFWGNEPQQTINTEVQHQAQAADDFWGNQPQQTVTPQVQVQQADDFWGGSEQTNVVQTQQVATEADHFWGGEQQNQQSFVPANTQQGDDFWGGSQQQTFATNSTSQQFKQVEKTPQQLREEELTRKIIEKQDKEILLKREKRNAAQAFLQNFAQERLQKINVQKKIVFEEEQILLEGKRKEEGKIVNPWEKVTKNISLKAGEYPGKADVTRMRESIQNKKSDSK